MNIKTTRFIISMTGVSVLTALAFYGLSKGDAIVAPLCVSGIMTIVGGYQWGKSHTNAKFIETSKAPTV